MSLGGKNEKNAFSGLLFRFSVLQYNAYLPVAQLDSASDSDSEGRRFESCRVGQKSRRSARGVCFFGLPAANLSRKRRRFACRREAASRAKRVILSAGYPLANLLDSGADRMMRTANCMIECTYGYPHPMPRAQSKECYCKYSYVWYNRCIRRSKRK